VDAREEETVWWRSFITSDLSHLLLISVFKETKLGRAVACMV